jgi:hypothetical protein
MFLYVPGLITTLLLIFVVLILAYFSKKGVLKTKYRPLAAVEGINECVGRCVEMNQPLMEQNRGALGMDTIAGIAFLGKTAKLCARYDVKLLGTTSDADTFTTTCAVVRDAYRTEGKAEKYKEENMYFGGGERQAFINMVMGMILREKPAAIITVGGTSEEILQFSDIGASIGALQIGGGSLMYNVGFLATMFDYCLIGEEIFAASAQIASTPEKDASLVTTDLMKYVMTAYLVIGSLLMTLGINLFADIIK